MAASAIPFDNSYAELPARFYAHQHPVPVREPKLIQINRALAETLNIDPDWLASDDAINMLAGNAIPDGAAPISTAYAGHQFGHFSPQLGDGRAVLLGEVIGRDGIRRDIQLKGSGPTPFSRGGDGRAAIGPVMREYIVSEHMHALGIPTTRSLAAVTTGEDVYRERRLPGAVLTRVAQSHLRIGTFEFFASRKDTDGVRTLADYAIDRHYPEARETDNPIAALLEAVIDRQTSLVAKWLGVGFIHGVMNTDNVSIAGETIDFGPCAFMDTYEPLKVFSSIDHMGRYAFMRQPSILQWNLVQFASALVPILADDIDGGIEIAQSIADNAPAMFEKKIANALAAKLGLQSEQDGDFVLVMDLLKAMAENEADFTLTFRGLSAALNDPHSSGSARDQFNKPDDFDVWASRWQARLADEDASETEMLTRLNAANPAVIARNHLVEAAIRAAEDNGDFDPFADLLDAVTHPFDDVPEGSIYTRPPKPEEVVLQTFCGT